MKNPVLFSILILPVLFVMSTAAQRPAPRPGSGQADAPATAPGGKPPDTVMLEELTWAEVRDLIAAGTTTVMIGTAGTEQKGPHMVDGEHKFVMDYAADKIARALGQTLVAPVITYVPEGSWERPTGHMGKPGTITLPEDRFVELLVAAGRSLKSGGFKTVLFLGESGGNRTGMRSAAEKLNELWKGAATEFPRQGWPTRPSPAGRVDVQTGIPHAFAKDCRSGSARSSRRCRSHTVQFQRVRYAMRRNGQR